MPWKHIFIGSNPISFEKKMLSGILVIPIVMLIYIWLLEKDEKDEKDIAVFRLGLKCKCAVAIWITFIWMWYENPIGLFNWDFHIKLNTNWSWYLRLGIDNLSLYLILLTSWLSIWSLLISWNSIKKQRKRFIELCLILEWFVLFVFMINDLVFFYIGFEAILIPMFLMIGIWGSRGEKIKASYYLFYYTLIGSLLMLIAILWIYTNVGSTDYLWLQTWNNRDENIERWLWLAFFIAFGVKMPLFPIHLWLPQAHVEAPTYGSTILAGILLKLGGYGLLRYNYMLFENASIYYKPLIWTLSILSIIYGSLNSLRQNDYKRLIAYSSVAHMGLVTLAILNENLDAIVGSIILMLGHGLVSGGLFIAVGILYERWHTRIINYYGGLNYVMPVFSTCFLTLSLANAAVPLSSNFVGEFIILTSIIKNSLILVIIAGISIVLSAAYSLFLYNRICMGELNKAILNSIVIESKVWEYKYENMNKLKDVDWRETSILILIVMSVIYIGVFSFNLYELEL